MSCTFSENTRTSNSSHLSSFSCCLNSDSSPAPWASPDSCPCWAAFPGSHSLCFSRRRAPGSVCRYFPSCFNPGTLSSSCWWHVRISRTCTKNQCTQFNSGNQRHSTCHTCSAAPAWMHWRFPAGIRTQVSEDISCRRGSCIWCRLTPGSGTCGPGHSLYFGPRPAHCNAVDCWASSGDSCHFTLGLL